MNNKPTVDAASSTEEGDKALAGGTDQPTGKLGRRALMLGAATGAGATAALLAGASPAGADNASGHVSIANGTNGSGNNAGSAVTSITADPGTTATFAAYNTSSGGSGLYGAAVGSSDIANDYNAGVVGDSNAGDGVLGFSTGVGNGGTDSFGVHGVTIATNGLLNNPSPAGVYGESSSGSGVLGISDSNSGVTAFSGSASEPAVYAENFDGGPGISGYAKSASEGVTGTALGTGSGVKGQSAGASGLNTGSAGVWGDSDTNDGVVGTSLHHNGVNGTNGANGQSGVNGYDGSPTGGYGVTGVSANAGGVGVHALNPTGNALQVDGVAAFSRSGVATLSAPATAVAVTVPGGLKTTSHVLATLQTDTGAATLAVHAAVPNTSTGKITIIFTGTAPVGAKVAWFVFG